MSWFAHLILGCVLIANATAKAADPEIRTIAGFDGVLLVVAESGNRNGPPILFIHGYSQSYLSWEKQLSDQELARDFHLIAFDLRGHGASAKPPRQEDYTIQAWAGDVAAVIAATTAKKPILVPWSMGGTVTISYVREKGVDAIAGIDFVAAAMVLGEPPPQTGEQQERSKILSTNIGGMLAADLAANIKSTRWFVGALTATPLPADEQENIFAYNIMTPAYVRKAMFGGPAKDFKGVPAMISVPVLFTHGDKDGVVAYQLSTSNAEAIAGARMSTYEGIGHAPFLEAPERFNRELAEFVRSVQE